MLGRRHREQGVRQGAAARRPPRGLGHAGRVRVDADHERVRPRRRGGEHVTAVTGAQVERDPGVTARELCDLADVEVLETAT